MIINNVDISNYNAQVSSKLIQTRDINIESGNVKDSYFFLNLEEGMKQIEIRILFKNDTRQAVYKDISDFMLNFKEEATIKFNNLDNYFNVFLIDKNIEETEFEDWLYLNLKVQGYEYGDLVTKEFNRITTSTINNPGNINSPCIIEIKPTLVDIQDFIITGLSDDPITIKTLRKNETVIIDSLNGTVKVGDNNKYGDTDMWEFPYLKKGINNITFSRNNCNITIKYNPRYL